MNIKNLIILLGTYPSIKFIDKLIEDNLPNLHYRNLKKYIVALVALIVVGYFMTMYKITGNEEYKKSLLILAVAVIAVPFLQENIKPRLASKNNRMSEYLCVFIHQFLWYNNYSFLLVSLSLCGMGKKRSVE